ncbi:MAG: radical SAM protein, partial [Spirochaetia bacterium]|nr:radical SAM protein [Spirochaetia bacterium]
MARLVKSPPKSILFIQLPLLDHTFGYVQGNFPYAGGAMMAYIHAHIGHDIKMELLPYMLANFASDMLILRYIKNSRPDIIAFTSYLWNLERNLRLAAAVRSEAAPGALIVMGGPEIAEGSAAFHARHDYIDFFVSGEGEWFFSHYLRGRNLEPFSRTINGNLLITQSESALIPAGSIAEPFTLGFIEPMSDSSIFLEMTRGCPYRCSYCYYSKNCLFVREMPFDNLLKALEDKRLSEIYILSPTFDRSADFTQKLKALESRNTGVSLHTEMRSDRIDAKTAFSLKRAGFNSMEVGLQTLNEDVLKKIRRGSDPQAELRGMLFMRDAGIDLKIGIIPGLPGESPETFEKSINTLVELGFAQNIELYPLMILPGTRIREEADLLRVSYQKEPPYYYLDGWGTNQDDIRKLTVNLELDSGFGQEIASLPDFCLPESGELVKSIYFDGRLPASWAAEKYLEYIESACFDFHIT